VETFAKIEMPVWRSYALGGGISTKAAAQALAKQNVQWCTNFYRTHAAQYFQSGGNGAAMRIQPHVWSATEGSGNSGVVRDIVRNSVVTDGHPRAIIGAAFHGLCLRQAFRTGKTPTVADWNATVGALSAICEVIKKDDELSTFWLPIWERESGQEL